MSCSRPNCTPCPAPPLRLLAALAAALGPSAIRCRFVIRVSAANGNAEASTLQEALTPKLQRRGFRVRRRASRVRRKRAQNHPARTDRAYLRGVKLRGDDAEQHRVPRFVWEVAAVGAVYPLREAAGTPECSGPAFERNVTSQRGGVAHTVAVGAAGTHQHGITA